MGESSLPNRFREALKESKPVRILALVLIATALVAVSALLNRQRDKLHSKPANGQTIQSSASDPDAMFLIESAAVFGNKIEVGKYRIEANAGYTLFAVTVRFTDHAKSIPADEMKTLESSPLAREMLALIGALVGPGDLQYRMPNDTLLPCSVMPLTEQDPSPPLSITSPNGNAMWLMNLGRLRAVASVPPGQTPVALIWGGKYEVPITTSPD